MKIKNLFAVLLTIILLTSTFIVPTSANGTTNNNIEIIILNENISNETKEKIQKYFVSSEPTTEENLVPYGLTCTLFGHKIEGSAVATITHKVRATSPRCKKETYNYEACTRCDYELAELVDTEYIVCCS